MAASSSGGGVSGLRVQVQEYLGKAGEAKEEEAKLKKMQEENRASERARELTMEESKLKLQTKQMEQMMKMQMALMKKAGMSIDSDDD